MEGCEHLESSPIGKCAICGRTVCTDCYHDVFGAMICNEHRGMEDESEWELVAYYTDTTMLEDRRYSLEEAAVAALVVESEDEATEIYVPIAEKEDAFAALSAVADGENMCGECLIQYSAELTECPVCGARSESRPEDTVSE